MTTSETQLQTYYTLWLIVTITVWTSIILVSLFWNYNSVHKQSVELASNVAQAYIYRDIALRNWGASHGGVYVPRSEHIKPNPLLSHIPDRDVITPSGRKLTLINPVHILTQVMNEYNELPVPKGRVTAFPEVLLNPQQNMPDQWELKALDAFKKGAFSKKEVIEINNIPHLRLMIPLFIKTECLLCHSNQSYKEGDLSGALGVTVPMTPYIKAKNESLNYIYFSYGVLWIIGIFSLTYFFYQARLHTQEQKRTQKELLQLNRELANLSFKDALTDIANRRSFDNALNREWKQARRNQTSLSLLMIDVDFFKIYNDCFGHQQGDDCLRSIAQTLAEVVKRPKDIVARYGGEEFVLLLPETELQDAIQLAEECRKRVLALNIPFELSEISNAVTISLGVCTTIPKRGDEPVLLLKAADRALYNAKKMGRNRVESDRTVY
ncbi:MAG: diguanylate cyclase [Burkholderiales bacterium]|nr:diguanylate cyclase [Nitrosomonas sp.]MCP5274700.1 diguanylate cyclase [Burkholderiales bacterium]